MVFNGFQEKDRDTFLDQNLSKLFVEREVCKIPTTLLMMVKILGVLEHVHHEPDCVLIGYMLITI